MTSDDIRLARLTFVMATPVQAETLALFFSRLFEIAPETRGLFKGELAVLGGRIAAVAAFLVAALDRLEDIGPQLEELAERQRACGVEARHQALFHEALTWALKRALGGAFTPDVAVAWGRAYARINDEMWATLQDGVLAA